MANKNTEIRRLALLRYVSTTTPIGVLTLAMELLKTETGAISVEKLFNTAHEIVERLPGLKKRIDEICLSSAKEVEVWVTSEDDDRAVSVERENGDSIIDDTADEDDLDAVEGVISAVSRSGKGILIGEQWYNVTERTVKRCNLTKGLRVRVKYTRGRHGFFAETVDPL